MAKVSVVIPTHNRPDRLSKAIRSVLQQTETDFELFVVDDGSADDSAAGVARACGDARVSYIRLPVSRGPAAARNVGIARATAPYIAFLDDDDEWLPEKLAVQLNVLEHSEPRTAVCYSARITVDKFAGTERVTRFPTLFDRASGRNVVTLSSVLMRRSCFDRTGVFDEDLFGPEDFDLWIRLAETFVFAYVDRPLLRYLIHADGISQYEPQARSRDTHKRNARSLERVLTKHRDVFKGNRRGYCLLYLILAERYQHVGDSSGEWKAIRSALKLWPFEPRVYVRLARALLQDRRAHACHEPVVTKPR